MPLIGVKQVRDNLKKEIRRIDDQVTARVLYQIGVMASGWAALITPIDTSNLVNSMFAHLDNRASGIALQVGYTARYALWVHESSGKMKGQKRKDGKGEYWDPNAEPEFLKKAFEQNMDAIWRIVVRGYKV
ncbi:hypothetical protein [Escherichia coli]|uniref:hypothetical protein n=1 Tax=Escherichia coli TaxID=562 RepID=UPI00287844DE|nr:hypothetical protein [Escherichia coli]MDS1650674.1 hypothetical protein [Escherichia coli]